MILRLCLKNKSSVLVEGTMENINYQGTHNQFIKVVNHSTKKEELYNANEIWCVRISSENDKEI